MLDSGVNHVLLSGSLARDPDIRELVDGDLACFLRLECITEQRLEGSEEHRLNTFDVLILGAQVKNIAPFLYTGSTVIIEGRLESGCWESQDIQREREAVSVFAERLMLLDATSPRVGSLYATDKNDR